MFIKLLTSTVLIKLLDPEPDPEQKFRIRIRFRLKKLGSSRIRIRIRIRNTSHHANLMVSQVFLTQNTNHPKVLFIPTTPALVMFMILYQHAQPT